MSLVQYIKTCFQNIWNKIKVGTFISLIWLLQSFDIDMNFIEDMLPNVAQAESIAEMRDAMTPEMIKLMTAEIKGLVNGTINQQDNALLAPDERLVTSMGEKVQKLSSMSTEEILEYIQFTNDKLQLMGLGRKLRVQERLQSADLLVGRKIKKSQ